MILLVIALGIGIYLILTTTLIAKDGVSYIHYAKALSSNPLETVRDCSDYAPPEYTPGYPFLILLTHRVANLFGRFSSVLSWIYSAQSVTLLCRLLALIPLYLIGKLIVGNKLSFWAILILVILPGPAKLGSDALRDWPHMLFLATGFLFLFWAARYGKWLMFGLVGVVAGLGYMIRPMCAQLLVYGVLWLIFNIFKREHKYSLSRTKIVGGLALLVIGFAVVASPYMKIRGEILPARLQQIIESFSYRYDSDEISKQNGNIYQAKLVPADVAKALWKLVDKISANLMYFFIPFLFVGMYYYFCKKPENESVFFITAFILLNIAGLILRYCIGSALSSRYVLPLTAFTIFFVPVGLQVLGREIDKLLCKTICKNDRLEEGARRWFFILLVVGLTICLPKLFRPIRIEKKDYRTAAEWLNKNTPENSLLAISGIDPRIVFYADRESTQAMSQNADYAVKMRRSNTKSIYKDGVFMFNGKDDFIDSGINPIPSSGDFTISGWVYCEGEEAGETDKFGTAFGSSTYESVSSAVKGIVVRIDATGNLKVCWGDGITWNTIVLVNDITTTNKQKWHHITLVYTECDASLITYVNGSLVGNGVQSYGDSGYNFRIGHSGKLNSSEAFWYGKVKSLETFNNALSCSDIADLYSKENIPVEYPIKYTLSLRKSQVVVYPLPLISLSKALKNN